MNVAAWKYHPRRSPRKRVPSLAVRLAIAALGEYQKQIESNIEADSECHRKVAKLVSSPGTIRIGTPMNCRFGDSGVVAITPEMDEVMRPRTFSAIWDYGSDPNAYYLPDDWWRVREPLPKPKGTA